MKTLDRYIVRSFLYSYMLCLLVMLGMRMAADLFVNIDEFAELSMGGWELVSHVLSYYGHNVLVYYQELNGIILTAAGAFTLARMSSTNELTAVLASGVSLYRVLLPIILTAMVLSIAGVVNQEVFIPRVKHKLVRSRDEVEGKGITKVRFVSDSKDVAWQTRHFYSEQKRMANPLILVRDDRKKLIAKITADEAVFDQKVGGWRLRQAQVAKSDGVLSTRFIPTPQSPAVVFAKRSLPPGQSPGDANVSATKFVVEADAIGGASFQILHRPAYADQPQPRMLANIHAPFAFYARRGLKWGYYLAGSEDVTAEDIIDLPRLCEALVGGEENRDPNHFASRMWKVFDKATRANVRACAQAARLALESPDDKGLVLESELAETLGQGIAQAFNKALRTRGFYWQGEAELPDMSEDVRSSLSQPWDRAVNRLAMNRLYSGMIRPSEGRMVIQTDLTPKEMSLRQSGRYLDYMSTSELNSLLRTGKSQDRISTSLTKHLRFTSPLANLIMMLVGVPFILSRQRNIKASALLCVMMVGSLYVFLFLSRYLSAYGLDPVIAAWLPVLVFGTVAAYMLDAIKT